MDECADAGDHHEHRLAQIVENKAKRDLEDPANIDPGELGRGDIGCAKIKQLQTKLTRTAATEMKLLTRFHEA